MLYPDQSTQNLKSSQGWDTVETNAGSPVTSRRPSALEELQKQREYHNEQTTLKSRGADFLRENPAFNEFITLIRNGSIGI